MANIKSAKKRIHVIQVKTNRNKRVKAHLKDVFKGFDLAIANGDKDEAQICLAKAEKKLMQAAAKGTIHKNAASRKVSRMTVRFNTVFEAAN
ncbi:MAG: 30S ribosomal protein S20 [Clostridiales Family XIII bacterium]|jgi:small subunit ribosomal protein S20|nr:30S ribosomal protein S20 [Clostridiales Family XIII bacterium]